MKSGFVSIIGRPNVGKSTLLNSLIDEKVAIVSKVPGTTRNVIQGIYNEEGYQIVFIDTPGIGKPIDKLGRHLNKEAIALTKDVDAVLFMVDVSTGYGRGDKFILNSLKTNDVPIILVLNKIDKISNEKLLKNIDKIRDDHSFAEIVPISAMNKDNTDRLLEVIKKYLTDDVKYFDEDEYTSAPASFIASEIVREKLFELVYEELPHGITCYTESFKVAKNIIHISVNIIVERDSFKKIIIGRNGTVIKQVGTNARLELEKLFGKKVYLETYVKTIKNWKDKEKYFKELGFRNN